VNEFSCARRFERADEFSPARQIETCGFHAEELKELRTLKRARPLDEWHEDLGPVLWWKFPIEEAPYAGDPLCSDWPGYHTHWTPLCIPENPTEHKSDTQPQEA
jgi:hypothetical protein